MKDNDEGKPGAVHNRVCTGIRQKQKKLSIQFWAIMNDKEKDYIDQISFGQGLRALALTDLSAMCSM